MNRESKAKHTAWKVKTNVHPETNGDPWGWVGRDVFGSGDSIPGVSITWTGTKGRDAARLIAAAPAMLEIMEMHIHALDNGPKSFYMKYGFNVSELSNKVRELIKTLRDDTGRKHHIRTD